ncbi:hypothetical protein BAUCODRAFT_81988, partial [Baudoinia panamericana UAMH 10762]
MADTNDSPPSSDLSDPPSIDVEHDDDQLSLANPSSRPSVDISHPTTDPLPPPSKRRKTTHVQPEADAADLTILDDDAVSLSSDNFSSGPGSPSHDEYALHAEAQLQCLWRDCPFGYAENNDDLVRHVQATHCATGGPKRTKYVCEWDECQRKTSNHPSGYALKAHMRSHTKEKPYYCALPECDKAFTRSDALAKHMRTVHEPEIPRSLASSSMFESNSNPKGKNIKLKLTNGASKLSDPDSALDDLHISPPSDNITYIPAHHPLTGQPGFMIHYPPDIQFTGWESSIPADSLMRLLRRQIHWAEQEAVELARECEVLERVRKEEWQLKEILLDGVMEGEL